MQECLMDEESGQIMQLILFIEADRLCLELNDRYRKYIKMSIAYTVYEQMQTRSIDYAEVKKKFHSDIFSYILMAIEDHASVREELREFQNIGIQRLYNRQLKSVKNYSRELILSCLPRALVKYQFGLTSEMSPIEHLMMLTSSKVECISTRLENSAEWETCIDAVIEYVDRIISKKCRGCGKAKVCRLCTSCKYVGFCSANCKIGDLQDEYMGHNNLECDLRQVWKAKRGFG